MDLGGSIQTSIFAYLLMAVVAMLAAVMVQRHRHRAAAGRAEAPACDCGIDLGRASGR